MINTQISLNKNEYYINRELSWLEFNDRVLMEAKDVNNPLFERLKFLSIVNSNLDEFFMVRVASLKDQVNAGYNKPDPSGLTAKQQLNEISIRVHRMVYEIYNAFNRGLVPRLRNNGIYLRNKGTLTKDQKKYLKQYFIDIIFPVLTPMAVNPHRSFPLILNKSINIGVLLMDRQGRKEGQTFATVQVPSVLPRLISLPNYEDKTEEFILLEEVIKIHIGDLFVGHRVICAHTYRITRNADLSIEEEEAEDLLKEIEKSLEKRKWGAAVRLEVDHNINIKLAKLLREALEIHEKDIFYSRGPLDLTFLWKIYSLKDFKHLKFTEYIPQVPQVFMDKENIFDIISKGDLLLHHPYESFDPVVDFVKKAARDPKVLAIKQTLYRVSGDSPIIKALSEAAEVGKQVTVLVELKARFDEEINILWAKRLEQAGCHVIYGLVGLKTHCKMTLVIRREENEILRYIHLGTGNYNDFTAKLYTDMSIFTRNKDIGIDVSAIFNMLSGYSLPLHLSKIALAPLNLRGCFLDLINREIKNAKIGRPAKIIAKMNSLVDQGIIKALYKASAAGVKIELIVRGICCLRPGISNVSENIAVRSIVGRVLEHSRIYYFYNDGNDEVYLSSADWMPRNLDRRIEVLFPIDEVNIKKRIKSTLLVELKDNVKARILNSDGLYSKIDKRGKTLLNSQMHFARLTLEKAEVSMGDQWELH